MLGFGHPSLTLPSHQPQELGIAIDLFEMLKRLSDLSKVTQPVISKARAQTQACGTPKHALCPSQAVTGVTLLY